MPSKRAWWILAIWLLATTIFLFWWRLINYGVFDPHSAWLDNAPLAVSGDSTPLTGKHIYHVRSGCYCDVLADRHVDLMAAYPDYQQHRVSATDMREMGIPVPSTPMLVVVEQGHVIYAGPYAAGPSCSPSASFIPQIIGPERKITTPWYNGNVSACRCAETAG